MGTPSSSLQDDKHRICPWFSVLGCLCLQKVSVVYHNNSRAICTRTCPRRSHQNHPYRLSACPGGSSIGLFQLCFQLLHPRLELVDQLPQGIYCLVYNGSHWRGLVTRLCLTKAEGGVWELKPTVRSWKGKGVRRELAGEVVSEPESPFARRLPRLRHYGGRSAPTSKDKTAGVNCWTSSLAMGYRCSIKAAIPERTTHDPEIVPGEAFSVNSCLH